MTRSTLGVVLAISGAMPACTPAADVAGLFPADTLAYAEVRQPADVVMPLAALLASDPVGRTHDGIDRAQNPQQLPGIYRAGLYGLLTTPEVMAEAKHLGGVGIGVVGFSARYEPRFAAAVLLGDSHAAGLLVRAFLATTPGLRRVADVDGVPVFQHRGFTGTVVGNDGKPLEEGDAKRPRASHPTAGVDEPTYAFTPGLFVIGTDTDAVADVLRRFAGRPSRSALATDEAFRRHAATRDRGGVFFYAVPPAIVARLDAATRAADGTGVDALPVAVYKFLLGTKALRTVAGNLHIHPATITFAADVEVDATVPSAALALVTGPAAAPEPPTVGVPVWSASLTMPPADRRAQVVLDFLDAHARAIGSLGRRPSEAIAEMERRGGPKLVADLLPGVRAVSVFTPSRGELPAGATPGPMIVLHTESNAIAEAWDMATPSLLALIVGVAPAASAEVVGDVRVRTFTADGLPGHAPLHTARVGSRVAIGQDRTLVATAAKVSPGEATTGAVSIVHLAPSAIADQLHTPPPVATPEVPMRPRGRVFNPRSVGSSEPAAAGWAAALRPLPMITGTLSRTPQGVRLEARLPGTKSAFSAAWAGYLDWVERQPIAPTSRPGYRMDANP